MLKKVRNAVACIWLTSVIAAGCGGGDEGAGPVDTNNPPVVTFDTVKFAVGRAKSIQVAVTATDDDMDPLTYDWSVSRGAITGGQGTSSITWFTPSSIGSDTATCVVSDGKANVTTRHTYKIGTEITTIVSNNTAWTQTNSPYIVAPTLPNFAVDAGAILTIQPGVEVYIDKKDISWQINGTLLINGTAGQPVLLHPNIPQPIAPFWEGIIGLPNSSTPVIDLAYADISYARNGIYATSPTNVFLDGCKITFSVEPAVLHESTGSLAVRDCIITNNTRDGIRVVGASGGPPASVSILRDSIAVNGDLTGQVQYQNNEAGIHIDIHNSLGNINVTIRDCEISRNGFPGIALLDVLDPVIDNNGIFGNMLGRGGTRFNLVVAPPFGSIYVTHIDARNNYWGFPYPNPADSTQIHDGIFDNKDNSSSVPVWVTPWLSTNP